MKRHTDKQVVVYSVWQPMLPTDWSKPGANVLRRLSDKRARQFWDPGHAVATVLKKATETGTLKPNCCENDGILWDLAAVYPPGARWEETLPQPVFLDGAVYKVANEIEASLVKAAPKVGR